jgi:hypothetical protein
MELVTKQQMELVFESNGPVVRNIVTKRKYQDYELRDPRFPFRFTLKAKKVDLTKIYGTQCFDLMPYEVDIICDEMIEPSVWNFFYTPLPDQPIYAYADGNLYELQDYVCNLDYEPKPKPCLITQLIQRAFKFSTSSQFKYKIL